MFNFFQTIIQKIVAVITTSIIAVVGLFTSAPKSVSPPISSPEVVAVTSTSGENIVNSKIEELQKEIEEMKKTKSQNIPAIPQSNKQITGNEEIVKIRKEIEALKNAQNQAATVPQELSNKDIVNRVKPAVVYIKTDLGAGSGIIVKSDGYILTNAHVLDGASSILVKLSDGRLLPGKVFGRDMSADLAIVAVTAGEYPTVELGDSDAVVTGDDVYTFGYPFGLEGDVSFKEGTISRRLTDPVQGKTYLEISAEIHPGNSGGPLVNKSGKVIGVNTMVIGKTIGDITLGETIKLAIPINTALRDVPGLNNASVSLIDPEKNFSSHGGTHYYRYRVEIMPNVVVFVGSPRRFQNPSLGTREGKALGGVEVFVQIANNSMNPINQSRNAVKIVAPDGTEYDERISWAETGPLFPFDEIITIKPQSTVGGYFGFVVPANISDISGQLFTIRYRPDIKVNGEQLMVDFSCSIGFFNTCL